MSTQPSNALLSSHQSLRTNEVRTREEGVSRGVVGVVGMKWSKSEGIDAQGKQSKRGTALVTVVKKGNATPTLAEK